MLNLFHKNLLNTHVMLEKENHDFAFFYSFGTYDILVSFIPQSDAKT